MINILGKTEVDPVALEGLRERKRLKKIGNKRFFLFFFYTKRDVK